MELVIAISSKGVVWGMNMDRHYKQANKEKVTAFLPTEMKDQLKIVAVQQKTSVQKIVHGLISNYLDSQKAAG
jgi:hypothetical protein